ncbi:hypothetical protein AMQ83_32045 [Paenibacillus riograndensis]|nr:hypothetical protein AMQ83_32045 [Paenibacillus riograndensis]
MSRAYERLLSLSKAGEAVFFLESKRIFGFSANASKGEQAVDIKGIYAEFGLFFTFPGRGFVIE